MHFSTNILPSLFLLYPHLSQANPIAQFDPPPCQDFNVYTKTDETNVAGPPQLLPVSCTPAGGEPCTVGTAQSYTVSVTITVGANLGLNLGDIVSLGVSASVSTTTAKGVTDSAGITCQGPWTCSVIVSPTVDQVTGEQHTTSTCLGIPDGDSKPYTVQFPLLGPDKTPTVNIEACACPNFEHWADAGAPPKCPQDCGVKP